MYKIRPFKDGCNVSVGTLSFSINPNNPYYQQFIQDVVEQGIGIVEGPDVVEPSYAELRAAEYPSREDQFDMMYWDKINGTTVWEDAIQAVKDKYPKTITGGTTIGEVPTWIQEAADNWKEQNPE